MRKIMKPMKYKNYDLPVGDLLCVSPGVAMRNPEMFEDPDAWNPQRWENAKDWKKFSFIAFGGGRHGCPGEKFGVLQVKTVLSVFFRNFDFELVGDFPVPDYTSLVVGPRQPCMVKYTRKPNSALAK